MEVEGARTDSVEGTTGLVIEKGKWKLVKETEFGYEFLRNDKGQADARTAAVKPRKKGDEK